MKRVTKKSLDELALVMPVICEMNQRYYVGGNSGNTGDSGGWGGDSGGYGDSGGWGGDSGGYGDTGTGSSNSGSFGGSGNSSGGSGNSDDPSYLAPPFFDDSGSFYYNQTEACPYWSYLAYVESGTWPGGVVEGRGYIPRQNGADGTMETGATSKDWATKLLRSIYDGGCCGTINLTDFVSSTGMTPISASNINITINGINLSNICIQGSVRSAYPMMTTGYAWEKYSYGNNNEVISKTYIYNVHESSEEFWITVPQKQIKAFESVFKSESSR